MSTSHCWKHQNYEIYMYLYEYRYMKIIRHGQYLCTTCSITVLQKATLRNKRSRYWCDQRRRYDFRCGRAPQILGTFGVRGHPWPFDDIKHLKPFGIHSTNFCIAYSFLILIASPVDISRCLKIIVLGALRLHN